MASSMPNEEEDTDDEGSNGKSDSYKYTSHSALVMQETRGKPDQSKPRL